MELVQKTRGLFETKSDTVWEERCQSVIFRDCHCLSGSVCYCTVAVSVLYQCGTVCVCAEEGVACMIRFYYFATCRSIAWTD